MHYLGLRHKRERKVVRKKHRHPAYIKFLDDLTLFVSIVGPLTVLPQAYAIFSTQSADGVSFIAWTLIFIVTLPWFPYGLAHRDKIIIVNTVIWEVANLSVMIGVLMYGNVWS